MQSDSYLWNPYSRQPQMQRGPPAMQGPVFVDYPKPVAQPVQFQEVALPVRRPDVDQRKNYHCFSKLSKKHFQCVFNV